MQPKPYKDNNIQSMTEVNIPQQLKTTTLVMKQLTKWVESQNREIWILRIVMLLALLIGYLTAKYFANSINHFLMQDFISQQWLVFGLTASAVLFLGGYVKAKLRL